MLCQNCKKNPATVHVTRIINNTKTELYLCQNCASEQGEFSLFAPFSVSQLLGSLLDSAKSTVELDKTPGLECHVCGMDYRQFKKTGLFGCKNCYRVFKDEISPIIKRIQGGATHHTGKVPQSQSTRLRTNKEIKDLKLKLQDAIKIEAFEEAAKLRDMIKDLEESKQGGDSL
ncbi:MAG: hypothetical protein GX352_01535 [Clostridiales bacterium]|nr:hypothetical protein [Clostridiales bacterium]